MGITSHDIAKMIDHSLLRPELTLDDIRRECAVARKYDVASVCCVPTDVKLCHELLAGSSVKVGAVVGFPHGYCTTRTKVFETEQAIEDGAVEIDMVLHIGRLLSRDFEYVRSDIKAVVDVAHAKGAIVKVILENCYLTDELKIAGCRNAETAGADFVKTSTGFAKGGATIPDLVLMRRSVSPRIQVKAAGGVRDLDMALKVRDTGTTRFGATRDRGNNRSCSQKVRLVGGARAADPHASQGSRSGGSATVSHFQHWGVSNEGFRIPALVRAHPDRDDDRPQPDRHGTDGHQLGERRRLGVAAVHHLPRGGRAGVARASSSWGATTPDKTTGRPTVTCFAADEDPLIPGLATLAEAMHRHGARCAVQLQHPGRQSAWPRKDMISASDQVVDLPGSAGHEVIYAEIAKHGKSIREMSVEETL